MKLHWEFIQERDRTKTDCWEASTPNGFYRIYPRVDGYGNFGFAAYWDVDGDELSSKITVRGSLFAAKHDCQKHLDTK